MFYYNQKDHIEISPGAYEIKDIEEFLNQKLNEKHGNSLETKPLVLRGYLQTLRAEI